MSLWEYKSPYGKGKGLLNQKNLTRHVIYKTLRVFQCGTLRNALFVEYWSNNRHTYLKDTDFALFCIQVYIKPMLLQNGPHHNSSTRGFDKNVFQIFLHNIYRKSLPKRILNGIDYNDISSLIRYIRNYT
jgi:hypothetical protein